MDFLDQTFASVNRAHYSEFLGIDFAKLNPFASKKTVTPSYDQTLLQKYPFSNSCPDHSETVKDLRAEGDRIWTAYLYEPDSNLKQQYLNQAMELKSYLDKAIDHLEKVACPQVNPIHTAEQMAVNNQQVNSDKPVPVAVSKPQQIVPGVDNKILTYAAAGVILLAIVKMIR